MDIDSDSSVSETEILQNIHSEKPSKQESLVLIGARKENKKERNGFYFSFHDHKSQYSLQEALDLIDPQKNSYNNAKILGSQKKSSLPLKTI